MGSVPYSSLGMYSSALHIHSECTISVLLQTTSQIQSTRFSIEVISAQSQTLAPIHVVNTVWLAQFTRSIHPPCKLCHMLTPHLTQTKTKNFIFSFHFCEVINIMRINEIILCQCLIVCYTYRSTILCEVPWDSYFLLFKCTCTETYVAEYIPCVKVQG